MSLKCFQPPDWLIEGMLYDISETFHIYSELKYKGTRIIYGEITHMNLKNSQLEAVISTADRLRIVTAGLMTTEFSETSKMLIEAKWPKLIAETKDRNVMRAYLKDLCQFCANLLEETHERNPEGGSPGSIRDTKV
jgi:hypothetical protein